jgi:hypothetical protein
MREGQRSCGQCGHELRPATRFCTKCGHPVPQSGTQATAPGSGQAPDILVRIGPGPPAFAPTVTSVPEWPPPLPVQPAAQPPPFPVQPGAEPPWRGPPAGRPRRSAFPRLLAVALAVLIVAAGGTAAAVFLTRHSARQPSAGQRSAAAVTHTTVAPTQAQPTQAQPTEVPTSASPAAPPTQVEMQGMTIGIAAVSTDPDASGVAATMAAYFGGIDARNYKQAWDTYTATFQVANDPYRTWAGNLRTSQDSQVTVDSIQHDANGDIGADVSFQSHQAGQYGVNPGETCTNWTIDYHLVPAAGATAGSVSLSYQINKVTTVGAGHSSC